MVAQEADPDGRALLAEAKRALAGKTDAKDAKRDRKSDGRDDGKKSR